MGILKTAVCDVCSKQKGTTNHWWVVNVQNEGDRGWPKLTISPFAIDGYDHQSGDFLCCGEKCAMVKVSHFLGANG